MVIVNFSEENMYPDYYPEIWQYDYGQILRIQGLNLPQAVEIHFALQKTGGTSKTRIGITKDGVTDVPIPDSMLENEDETKDYDIYAFIYITDETSGQTEYRITLRAKARPKPEVPGGGDNPDIFHEVMETVRKAMEAATESEKQAEGWAHGSEDLPERLQDNAKYYSEQAREDSMKTDADRKEVGRLVESVSGIGEQVEKVEGLTKQAQTSATNAALSEQAAKESENNAAQARAGAEVAEDNAELAAQRAEQDKAIVEQVKNLVKQMGQEVLDNKNLVDETAQNFDLKAQQALADVNNAGQTQTERVQTAGNDAVESVKTAQGTATRAVETAKTEAIKAVQTEGTTQAGNVSAEGEKQVQAVRGAAQEIVADRGQIQENKTGIAKLKEDIEQIKSTAYTDTFFKNFFALQRTGKKYTVKFPLWETSQVSTGEKLDDNAGLIIEPSTITEKGRDDYAEIPLFKTYDCNVERINGKLQITAMKGDVNYNAEEKDTFVLGMPYYQKTWVQDGYFYLSRSDVQHEGYILCPEAKKTDGMRSFCLYAKYVSGRNSSKIIGSYKGKAPVRNILSHNGCITEGKKRGEGYCFGSSYDIAYIQNTFLIKYADRDWNKRLGGHFASSGNQFLISKPETGAKRVVLAKANAEKFPIGSSVSVGDLGEDTNKDRGNAKIHNICDNVKILDIIEVDVDNKALVLDISENITTTSTTWVTSMHWNSGFSDDIIGRDGCPCKTKSQISSMLYPSVIQGIECMVGGYETLGNAFMDIIDGTHRDVYVCDDSTKLTTDINTAKKNYKKLPKQMTVTKNAQWCYGTNIHIDLENGMNIITQAGESGSGSSTGFCDGIYFDNATTGQREFLLLGYLGYWGIGGAFCSACSSWLGDAWWGILARLSLNVYRGEFA